MIKSNLHVLMGNKKIKSILQLSEQTKISRLSLSKLYNDDAKGVEFATLNTLCTFFNCSVGELLEFVPDSESTE